MGSVISFLKGVFALNTKSLSYCRIAVGVIILLDLIRRTVQFDALFLDSGMLPFKVLFNNHSDASFWSLYALFKAEWRSVMMLILHWIIAICFTLGWKTKEMSVMLWIFTTSLYGRNPMLLNGGDTMLKVLLFWLMFLPVGNHYSVDALTSTGKLPGKQDKTIRNIATSGLIIQLLCVYTFTFLMKTDPIWTTDFTAIYYALSLDSFRTAFGTWMYQYPELMRFFTAGSYVFEGFAAILLFVPRRNKQRRKVCIVLFMIFHLGLAATMHLGLFPFVAIAYWVALWPARGTRKVSYDSTIHSLVQGGLLLVIALTISWNIRTLDFDRHEKWLPPSVNGVMFALRLEQSWSMFSPYPFKDDGWYEFSGVDRYGQSKPINALMPGIRYSHNAGANRRYSSELRHKYYGNMWRKKNSYLRQPFLSYICSRNPELQNITMRFVREYSLDNYQHKPYQTITLATTNCN